MISNYVIGMKFNTIDELLIYTSKIKNKSLNDIINENKEFNDNYTMKKRKGVLGNLVETEFYHYPNNNSAEADFQNLGVELKTTGIKKTKKGEPRAKERLVLSMINYENLVNEDFENSHLMKKNETLLMLFYCYNKDIDFKDFKFIDYLLYSLRQDEDIIRNDFNIIKKKVQEGMAHELSEGDTTYLGACRKGRNGKDVRRQPNSSIPAPSRAFCLKSSYMTSIITQLYEGKRDSQDNTRKHKYLSVIDYVKEQLKPYFGLSQIEIARKLNLLKNDTIPKNINKLISDKLIGKDKDLKNIDDIFKNSRYIIKNSPVLKNFKPKERMSFRNLKFSDFIDDWDNSIWKLYFEEVTIINICYEFESRSSKLGEGILKDVKKVTFNSDDIDSIKITYNMIQNAIKLYEKGIFEEDLKKYQTLLPKPKKFDKQIMEIMPKQSKGKNSYNTFFVNNNDTIKVCFGLTKETLHKKLVQ